MNWSSVKNLLIAILVAANVFLLFNIVRQDRTRAYIPESEVSGAVQLLLERGLFVPKDAVPLKKFDASVYESRYSDTYYTETAEALTKSPREMLYTLPDGGISITAENGDFVDFDTEFGFRYAASTISDADAYTEITVNAFDSGAENDSDSPSNIKLLREIAADFLASRLSDDSPLAADITDFYTDGDMTYLLAEQTLHGHPLYSHFAMCVFHGDVLVYAHGRWYFSDVSEDHRTELCDQVSILFADLQTLRERESAAETVDTAPNGEPSLPPEDVGAQEGYALPDVKAVKTCYTTYWNADKTALYFIPAWQIDHINLLTIVYNAVNRTVYSVDE